MRMEFIEIFSLGVTADVLRTNIDYKSAFLEGVGHFQPNFHAVGYMLHKLFLHIGL